MHFQWLFRLLAGFVLFLIVSVKICLYGVFIFLSQNFYFKYVEGYQQGCKVNLQDTLQQSLFCSSNNSSELLLKN